MIKITPELKRQILKDPALTNFTLKQKARKLVNSLEEYQNFINVTNN